MMKSMPQIIILSLSLLFTGKARAQLVPENGVRGSKPVFYALTHATILVSPEEQYENATLLIKGDEIIAVGKRISIPKNAVVIDCSDRTIMASFIELSSGLGIPKAKSDKKGPVPQMNSLKKGAYYWNESIHPEINASDLYSYDEQSSVPLIKSGFGYALVHQQDGISRGSGAFISLGTADDHKAVHHWGSTSFYSFQKGVSKQSYPSSQMGSIALLRQAFYDTQWYRDSENRDHNLSLEALARQWNATSFFYTDSKWELLRAAKIANEFNRSFHYIGSGDEYGILETLKALNSAVVIPINFPKAYDVTDPYVARQVPLRDLKHWEMAPYNPAKLAENGIPFCISYAGHKTEKDFWAHLRSAIQHGLSVNDGLYALTCAPAKVLGIEDKVGTLEKGKKASFTVYDGNPFTEEAQLLESWFLGKQQRHETFQTNDISGRYNLLLDGYRLPIKISGTHGKWEGNIELVTIKQDTTAIKVKIAVDQNDITLQFPMDTIWHGSVHLRGKINSKLGIFEGDGMLPTGKWIIWSAIRNKKEVIASAKKEPVLKSDSLAVPWFPNMAYGFDSIPAPETIVIQHATIWTNEEDGILENATLIVENKRIKYCGTGKPPIPNGARIIDAQGRHVTSGIVDEHSHIAISKGVNESGQAVSAEVSIAHVVNPDDINIYRQLSGGVTTAQLLHGSANPIGGQSALVKLKWGSTAEEMLIDNAPKFIKCALGENVKQSNWGEFQNVRFPQTRMGVEQVFYDAFERSKAYDDCKAAYQAGKKKGTYRVDLELEALSEIRNNERFITCHSYVQSEINMLMHMADSMGFGINTFTHILEGYKLADKMAIHGAGGSTFADWWAYKYEVNDAIPYNAKLMHDQGVVVAINSDDAEMGRRLNQEAAKTVKYGGMTEEDAWKTVTLNPAKLLHLDDRIGSLKPGKDADIVIWSDNPLSIKAQVDYTIIEGTVLYASEQDEARYMRNQAEKARIISKMLNANKTGNVQKFVKKKKGHFHCNTIGEDGTLEENIH